MGFSFCQSARHTMCPCVYIFVSANTHEQSQLTMDCTASLPTVECTTSLHPCSLPNNSGSPQGALRNADSLQAAYLAGEEALNR